MSNWAEEGKVKGKMKDLVVNRKNRKMKLTNGRKK